MNVNRLLWVLAIALMLALLPATLVAAQNGNETGPSNGPGPDGSPDEGDAGEEADGDAPPDFESYCEAHPDAEDCQEYEEHQQGRERMEDARDQAEERRRAYQDHAACREEGRDDCPTPPLPPEAAAMEQCARLMRDTATAGRGMPERQLDAMRQCCETVATNVTAARCDALRAVEESLQQRRFIDFQADFDHNAVWNYSVGGQLRLEGAWYETDVDVVPDVVRLPHTITVMFWEIDEEGDRDDRPDAVWRLHDNPTGLMNFHGDDGSFYLDLPPNTTVREVAPGELYMIEYADGARARIVGDDVEVTGDLVRAGSFASFHLLPQGRGIEERDHRDRPAEVEKHIEEALERRHLGATVSVQMRSSQQAASVEEESDAPEVLTYDDVEVRLWTPSDRATASDPLWVEVEAHLPEGRTIVIDVDPAVLSAGPDLQLRYYDVVYAADGTRQQVEVLLVQADSIQDVMDPTDDGIQPEYWVVKDETGTHVLLSVPTWSTHALSVASVGEFIVQPSVAIGLLAGLLGSGLAAYGMFRPRKEA